MRRERSKREDVHDVRRDAWSGSVAGSRESIFKAATLHVASSNRGQRGNCRL